MSYWTHITGAITVSPLGRTQAERRYILETVLEHLPLVTGSERDMNVHIVQKSGLNESCSCDEFGMQTNNLKDRYGKHSRKFGWLDMQSEYILVVEGDFRDRMFDTTYREFMKWLCRLAKRVMVLSVVVNIDNDFDINKTICCPKYDNAFYGMFESPSWYKEPDNMNWCEYLMWDRHEDYEMPAKLAYKYWDDEENKKRVENWLGIKEKNKLC